MSISRFNAAAFMGNLEQTMALASFNFDFTLIKYEPQPEYKELGLALSPRRCEEGESGTAHITARKLGALLGELIPKTPNLFRVYGLRASEIASNTPRGTYSDGIFLDYAGADGTTIWAAATSGKSTIAVHLLGCMLASIWSAPEAVSIWTEVIAERKKILSNLNENDSLHISSLAASQVTISRDQISLWDSSIRAWLLTANEACKISHTQFRLIIENIGLGVNTKVTVYPSVIEAWINAMTTVEKVLCGEGQSILTGAPLLGFLSWHVYPDILVLGETTKSIQLNDPLIPSGGLITLGLSGRDSLDEGVYWSLPLSYMRYYGDPVKSTGNVNSQTSRLTMEQLMQIALGCLLQGWTKGGKELLQAAEVLILIANLFEQDPCLQMKFDIPLNGNLPDNKWLATLRAAAENLHNAEPKRQSEYIKLIKAGQRRYRNFLAENENVLPAFFGLSNPEIFMEVIQEPEYRIEVLREIAKQYKDIGAEMIIQYSVDGFFECASVRPRSVVASDLKKTQQGSVIGFNNSQQRCHVRWLAAPKTSEETERQKKRCEDILRTGEEVVFIQRDSYFPDWTKSFGIGGMHGPQMPKALFDLQSDTKNDPRTVEYQSLQYVTGSLDLATLYVVGAKLETSNSAVPPLVLAKAFRAGPVEKEACRRAVLVSVKHCQTIISLRALSTVKNLFKNMPGFTTPIKVANVGLWKGKWIPKNGQDPLTDQSDFRLSLQQTFACVALFESGVFNLDPEQLREVMAISSGNSLFVPKVLLRDPCEAIDCSDVVRITGNLGRPGMSMLIPPKNPKSLDLGDDCWVHINHDVFNGKREDCFPNSTLHLGFTGFEMPIDIGDYGLIDTHINFLEALVSLHSRGTWIADLDILRSMKSMQLWQVRDCNEHSEEEASFENSSFELIAVDSWEELLESPDNIGFVRANTNWQARLAAMALGIQRGHTTLILHEKICWKCVNVTLMQLTKIDSPFTSALSITYTSDMESDDSDASVRARESRAKRRKLSKPIRLEESWQEEETIEFSMVPFLIG